MEYNTPRITLNPAVCQGRPTIRNMRFTVAQMLELLSGGMSTAEVLDEYPFLEAADVHACVDFAARGQMEDENGFAGILPGRVVDQEVLIVLEGHETIRSLRRQRV